jgi:ferredoxin-NADP reductase
VIVTLSIIGRAFYAGRASRQGVTTTEAFYASAERWEGRLRVARKFLETGAVQTFRLMTETGAPLPFHWKAGQYVTLALQTPNGPIRRAYTIASSPNQSRFLEITVKREATGGGSQYLHDDVQVGQLLSVKGPQGDFTFMGDEADSIVMIAGGVGITPMMSTLRHLTETAWTHPVTLIYGTQSLADVIFRDELAVIEKRYPNFRLHLLPTTVEDPTWAGPQGYLSPEMILGFVPNIAHARVHLCGPAPMMAAVLKMLDGLGVNEAAIFTEAFTSLPFEPGPGADEEISMTFAKSNKTVIARRGDGVIRVAEANGIAMDYSCRNGECGSCRCKLLAGEVDMPDKTSLTAKERKTGFILACVARPVSDAITLDL